MIDPHYTEYIAEEEIRISADIITPLHWEDFTWDSRYHSEELAEDFKSEMKRFEWRDKEGELHRLYGPAAIYYEDDGCYKYWYLNGKRHRENGPAIIYPNGIKKWFLNDKLHREDGPAIIYPDGREVWYSNNNYHRLDGPAVINIRGEEFYFIHNIPYSKEGYQKKVKRMKLKEKIKQRLFYYGIIFCVYLLTYLLFNLL